MNDVADILVYSSACVGDAMRQLTRTGRTILLLVDEAGRLLRTVTDGDLRRLLVAGSSLDTPLTALPSQEAKTVCSDADPSIALKVMNASGIDQVPAVDSSGIPRKLYLRRDLDAPILLSTPHMGDQELQFIESAFRTNWIAPLGPNVDAFENELAALVGVGHAAAVSSGTAGIHLALQLLGVSTGDIVFCSTLTFVASVNPIVYLGAKPVFIDSEEESWNMSALALERALNAAAEAGKLPKAVIIVSLYGQSADMDPLLALCERHGVPVVEDAAESLGASYKGKASGTLGRIGVYSFNGNKIITTSGGGMIVSNDAELISRARFLATQARDPAPFYLHTHIGYNYRLSNVLAGIGRGQLKVLHDRVNARRAVFERYSDALKDCDGIAWMPESGFGRSTRWLTVATLTDKAKISATELIKGLATSQIEARPAWNPMHRQPVFAGCQYFPHKPGQSVADDIFNRGVCLPSGSNMTTDQQDRIITTLHRLLSARG